MTSPVRHDAQVGRSFLSLGLGEAVARAIAFGATVYLARTLGASLYGVIVLATAVLLYLTFIADLGVGALGIRDVAADPDRLPQSLAPVLGARLLVAALLAVVTAGVGLGVMTQPDGAILAAYGFSLLPSALGTKWAHLGLERAGPASIGRIAAELTGAALVLLLIHGPDDLGRAPVTQVLAEGVGALVMLRLLPGGLGRSARAVLSPASIPPLVTRSWPLVLNALLGLAIFNSDFLFLRGFRDAGTVGYYAAAYTLISFFLNLGASYTMTLLPVMTRLRGDPDEAKSLFDGSMSHVMGGALPIAVGGFLVAGGVIDLIFTPAFHPATLPLMVLIWTIPVALIRNVSQTVLVGFERQDQLLRTVAWAAGCNVVLNLALIPRWGMTGAAVATLVTEMLRTTLVGLYAHRLGLPMTPLRRFGRIGLAVLAMATVVWLARPLPVVAAIACGAVTYALGLLALGVVRLRPGALPEFVG